VSILRELFLEQKFCTKIKIIKKHAIFVIFLLIFFDKYKKILSDFKKIVLLEDRKYI
jgi:hypothetical protein